MDEMKKNKFNAKMDEMKKKLMQDGKNEKNFLKPDGRNERKIDADG